MIIRFSTIAFSRIEIDSGSKSRRKPSDQSQFRDKNYCYANLKDYKINENNGSMIYKDGTYEDYKNPKGTEFSFYTHSFEKFEMILNDTSLLRCRITIFRRGGVLSGLEMVQYRIVNTEANRVMNQFHSVSC